MKKLWLLRRLGGHPGWEVDSAHVVVADAAPEARRFACYGVRGNDDDWLDAALTSCVEVDMSVAGVVLTENTGA